MKKEEVPATDQWKLDGNCLFCRRANYCHKNCHAKKKHNQEIAAQAFRDVLSEKYPDFAKQLTNSDNKEDT